MTDRADLIRYWMRPASPEDIIKQVSALAATMKKRVLNDETTSAILDTYVLDLADQPFFAIQEACTAFRRILVGDGWMPIPGELLVVTKKKTEWLRTEAGEINRILKAEIVAEAPKVERASVRARVDALKAELQSARSKNEIARGFQDVERPEGEDLTPNERLEKTAKAYRDKPVRFSGSVNIRRPPMAA